MIRRPIPALLVVLLAPPAWARPACEVEARGPATPASRLALAMCLRDHGQLSRARQVAEAALEGLTGAWRATAYEIIAEAAIVLGQGARAAQALARAARGADGARRERLRALASRLGHTIDTRLAYDALTPTRFPAGHLAVRLAEAALAAGRLEEARAFLTQSRPAIEEDAALRAAAARLWERIEPGRAAPVSPPPPPPPAGPALPAPPLPAPPPLQHRRLPPGVKPRIGILAPLSGPAKEIGERIVHGATMAAALREAGELEVVVRDSAGDPIEAARQVESLARDDRVLALVGPVLTREARAAATRASELGVPIVTLAAAEGVTGLGASVYRCFLTTARQATALARHAVGSMGLRTFAVLHPRTPYGEAMRSAFEAEVRRLGATVVTSVSYARGQERFADEAAALRRHRFDALFFPDGYRTVALAAGYLASGGLPIGKAAGRREVRLLGTNEWYSPELLRRAGRFLQGAVLTVGFSPESTRAEVQAFLQAASVAGRTPSYIEAFAFDAVRLVRAALARPGVDSRAALPAALSSVSLQGATGALRFDERREIEGAPAIVRVEGDRFQPVGEPAPGASAAAPPPPGP